MNAPGFQLLTSWRERPIRHEMEDSEGTGGHRLQELEVLNREKGSPSRSWGRCCLIEGINGYVDTFTIEFAAEWHLGAIELDLSRRGELRKHWLLTLVAGRQRRCRGQLRCRSTCT